MSNRCTNIQLKRLGGPPQDMAASQVFLVDMSAKTVDRCWLSDNRRYIASMEAAVAGAGAKASSGAGSGA